MSSLRTVDTLPARMTRPSHRPRIGDLLTRNSGVVVIVLMIVVFSVWLPNSFATETTARLLLSEQSLTAILAIGLIFPVAAGQLDLSVAANYGFSAIFCAYLMARQGVSWPLAIVLTIVVAVLVGAVNAVLVVVFDIASIIATLATSSVLTGASLALSGSQDIAPLPSGFTAIGDWTAFTVPVQVFVAIVVAVVAWFVLSRSATGRRIYAVGANADAARLAGIRVKLITVGTLVAVGLLAGITGVLETAKLGAGSVSVGGDVLLPVFAAVFLGATQVRPGRVNVIGTIIAILIVAIGVKGLQLGGGDFWVSNVFNGVALALAVAIANLAKRRRAAAAPAADTSGGSSGGPSDGGDGGPDRGPSGGSSGGPSGGSADEPAATPAGAGTAAKGTV